MKIRYAIQLALAICFFGMQAQEIDILKVEDFDLKGHVKTCLVITDYGKETFEFNEQGLLVKNITQYNETDKDFTIYKYEKGHLLEKRMESYKDNQLDAATSMANFYRVDSSGATKLIFEKILSYDKEFSERQIYHFNEEDKLCKISISHENAIDEMIIDENLAENEITKDYYLNEVIQKSLKTSINTDEQGNQTKVINIKEYLDGEPNIAKESVYNANGILIAEETFYYNHSKEQFESDEKRIFAFDAENILEKETVIRGNSQSERQYIFQFDSHEPKNWVKKIITPDNSFITRKIEYYAEEASEIEAPK